MLNYIPSNHRGGFQPFFTSCEEKWGSTAEADRHQLNVNCWCVQGLPQCDSVMTGSRFSADLQSGGRIAPGGGEADQQRGAVRTNEHEVLRVSCRGWWKREQSWPTISGESSTRRHVWKLSTRSRRCETSSLKSKGALASRAQIRNRSI